MHEVKLIYSAAWEERTHTLTEHIDLITFSLTLSVKKRKNGLDTEMIVILQKGVNPTPKPQSHCSGALIEILCLIEVKACSLV